MSGFPSKVRCDAIANCAWHDAVMPEQAEGMRAVLGGGKAQTYESVKGYFGEAAAEAWQDAIAARQRFFAAVR